jgi:hypothetical protein
MDYWIVVNYLLYLILTSLIVVYLGWLCYRSGIVFTRALSKGGISIGDSINKQLLIAYYCLNIGFVFFNLQESFHSTEVLHLFIQTITKIGKNILLIGVMHLINTLGIYFYYHLRIKQS